MSAASRPRRPVVVGLVLALLVVVGLAFAVSWNALHDVAAATGARGWPASVYPFVVDGLMALALVASLVLRGSDRRFALAVLGAYTAASLVLNYVHGLVPGLHTDPAHTRLAGVNAVHWVLVGVAASLPVGSIFFGSDLVARVLQQRTDGAAHDTGAQPGEGAHVRSAVPTAALHADASEGVASSVYVAPADVVDVPAQPATAQPVQAADGAPEQPPAVKPAQVRTRPDVEAGSSTPRRPRQTPGAAKLARPVRTDAELLAHLQQLRTGADGPLSQRAVLSALGIGVPRLRALLEMPGAGLDPLPEPEPIRPALQLLASSTGEGPLPQAVVDLYRTPHWGGEPDRSARTVVTEAAIAYDRAHPHGPSALEQLRAADEDQQAAAVRDQDDQQSAAAAL